MGVSLEELNSKINESLYPKNIKEILLRAVNFQYSNIDEILKEKQQSKKCLMIYTDDILDQKWVLDLTGFHHPWGIGPPDSRFHCLSKFKLDVTDELRRGNHGNDEIELLMSKIIGLLKN